MKSFSVKFAGIFAVAAFALTATASAQSVAELQAMIAQLQSQIAAASSSSTTAPATSFTRDLTIGSTGPDVTALQTWLESKGFLTIPTGVSKGYFGEMTRAALAKYQVSAGISPAAGYFGPTTRAKVSAAGGSTTTTTTTTTTTDLSGGETSLESEDLQAEDDAEEGEMAHVATFEFDVEDADASVDRLDLEFTFDGQGSADSDPWDVFETITLMVDGEEIAEVDVNDEDEWLRDNTPFVFRVNDIDYVAQEGETAEIEVYVTSMNNVDGADNGDAEWLIAVDDDGLRATDGEGIQNYVGNDEDTVAFEVNVLGEGEDVSIKSSSANPDASTLLVDTDADSEWHEVLIFDLESDESDIELDTLVLEVETGTANYNDVVNDVKVEIDGEEFNDFDVLYYTSNTLGTLTASAGSTPSKFAKLTFDLDGDFTIDADEQVEVVVMAEFNETDDDANYVAGSESVQFLTVSVAGEGKDDVSDASVVTGEEHTLSVSVAEIEDVSWTSTESANGASGNLDLFFTVTATEEDFDVLAADIIDDTAATFVDTAATTLETDDLGVLSRVSGDSVTGIAGGFRVNEGDTVRFRVRYEATATGSYEVTVDSVAGTELADDKQLSPTLILE